LDKAPIALAESMRYLVARFQMREDAKFPSRLGVTSALHGEGVTTISRTLSAIVAHDLERRVCWVDLTWPRRQETNSHAGIVDVLSGGTSLEDAIQVTGDVQLSILAPGRVPEGQGESFARSLAIGALLDELSDRFDCLIMDTPPVLAGSASLVQLRHASAYLLVVRQGVTSTQQIRAVTDELTSIPTMGVVLNAYKSRIPKRLSHFFVR
jgi:Mrp family chromosome partitioning ATPase